MKVCVTARGDSLDAQVDQRFGRASYFIAVDTDTMEFEAIENNAVNAAGGAGVTSAKTISDTGAQAVLTGNCGPKAFSALQAAGVKVYTDVHCTVREAVEQFKSGKLTESDDSNTDAHSGM